MRFRVEKSGLGDGKMVDGAGISVGSVAERVQGSNVNGRYRASILAFALGGH